MLLIVGGHQRSGTTMLQEILRRHPAMFITFEFANFLAVGQPRERYVAAIRRQLKRRRGRSILTDERGWRARLHSRRVVRAYLRQLAEQRTATVQLPMIEAALRHVAPGCTIVGDKYPGYVFRLDRLAGLPGLKILVIYRDGRDVTSSMLTKVRGEWRDLPWSATVDTAAKIANRWVRAMETMERHRAHVYPVRYESLVESPRETLDAIGAWLQVDPAGFEASSIHTASLAKGKKGLTSRELHAVEAIAGPLLEKYGYPSW